MKKSLLTLSICVWSCLTFGQKNSTNEQQEYAKAGYRLVWADEFNQNGKLDTNKWKYERGFVRNQELQWYQEDNAWCENGLLIIEGRKEQKPNPGYRAGSQNWAASRKQIEYTSSSVNTRGKHSWQYGRFVMRGKIDISSGLWPAWWTLGVAGQWPSNGEIDIMEYYRKMLLANIAIGTNQRFKAQWYSNTKNIDEMGGTVWASKFHTWRMDWDEEAIALYVDDTLLNRVEMSKLNNRDNAGLNPFKQPHYMLLNLAMGGQNGGEIGDTAFPNRFEIDYVRVYQKTK